MNSFLDQINLELHNTAKKLKNANSKTFLQINQEAYMSLLFQYGSNQSVAQDLLSIHPRKIISYKDENSHLHQPIESTRSLSSIQNALKTNDHKLSFNLYLSCLQYSSRTYKTQPAVSVFMISYFLYKNLCQSNQALPIVFNINEAHFFFKQFSTKQNIADSNCTQCKIKYYHSSKEFPTLCPICTKTKSIRCVKCGSFHNESQNSSKKPQTFCTPCVDAERKIRQKQARNITIALDQLTNVSLNDFNSLSA